MARLLGLVGLLVAVAGTLACAEEPREKLDQPKEKLGGKLDLDKLKQLREKKDGPAADTSGLNKVTWKVGGVEREAMIHAPAASGSQKRPVLFAFHGHFGKAEQVAKSFKFHQLWPEAVVVYPQGLPTAVPVIDTQGKGPGWQKYIGDQQDRDLEFFDAMLKTLKAEYQIDDKRVFAAGHSNGGYFCYVLWPARGDQLAAVAPVAAALDARDAKMMKPKPVLHVAGEKDPIVKFEMQEKTIDQVRKLNGCDPMGKLAGANCTEYTSKNGPPVIAFIHPGNHGVPAGAPQRIVEFFKEQKSR